MECGSGVLLENPGMKSCSVPCMFFSVSCFNDYSSDVYYGSFFGVELVYAF